MASSRINQNHSSAKPGSVLMYIDMNSFFASCEQQENPKLRNKPIGVITHPSEHACVIAPSIEAKVFKVKTGMRLPDCRALCPQLIAVLARPYVYRDYHVKIMKVLHKYCDDVIAKSIDEAVMNFSTYRLVYKDFRDVAMQIKADLREVCGEFVKCSIGIAPNAFLAKLATEIQKPDGLIEITPENIDGYLQKMQLTDLPGIANANASRLRKVGINTPYDLRHGSESLLRKAFGGVVGNYWHRRLNFVETDMYKNDYRAMSAGRTVSRQQRENPQALASLLISLCTRLEQRLVKQHVFCRQCSFLIRYHDAPGWDVNIHFGQPLQDATELRRYIMQRVEEFEKSHNGFKLFNNKVQHMGVAISNFVSDEHVQYTLFDNKIKQDKVRKTMYQLKDLYGKNMVRKASETVQAHEMRDAIGFGSVKDLYEGDNFNQYLLEDDSPEKDSKRKEEFDNKRQQIKERKANSKWHTYSIATKSEHEYV
ncbi:MAG: DNA polymerase IV [Bacteroidetes bacterium]|nr:DNA polymerase IV [Bacteroidota bacterium]